MSVSIGVSGANQTHGGSTSLSVSSLATAAGSTLVAYVIHDGTWSGISDSESNSWTQRGSTLTYSGVEARCYTAENISTDGSQNVTVNLSAGGSITLIVIEVKNAATSSYDDAAGQVDTGEPWTTGGLDASINDAMLVAFYGAATTSGSLESTDANGATRVQEVDGSAAYYGAAGFYRVLTASGNYDVSVSDTGGETVGMMLAVIVKGVAGPAVTDVGLIARVTRRIGAA